MENEKEERALNVSQASMLRDRDLHLTTRDRTGKRASSSQRQVMRSALEVLNSKEAWSILDRGVIPWLGEIRSRGVGRGSRLGEGNIEVAIQP